MIKILGILFLCMGATLAHAQTLPPSSADPLRDICTGFLQQGGGSVAGDQQKLCTCLVAQTQKQLTHDEMVAYHAAAVTGQPPPPAIMQKVVGIATLCLTQAAR